MMLDRRYFMHFDEYITKCNKTINEIFNTQLATLGIDSMHPSLTRKIDIDTDEIWWLGNLILRVKYREGKHTPKAHIWHVPPDKLAVLKQSIPLEHITIDGPVGDDSEEEG